MNKIPTYNAWSDLWWAVSWYVEDDFAVTVMHDIQVQWWAWIAATSNTVYWISHTKPQLQIHVCGDSHPSTKLITPSSPQTSIDIIPKWHIITMYVHVQFQDKRFSFSQLNNYQLPCKLSTIWWTLKAISNAKLYLWPLYTRTKPPILELAWSARDVAATIGDVVLRWRSFLYPKWSIMI